MFRKLKQTIVQFFTRNRTIRGKTIAWILMIAILATNAYFIWGMQHPEYAAAEVAVPKPIEDNRSIKERLWDDLDEYDFTLDDKINAMILIGGCENKYWDEDADYNNGDSVDRGLFQINSKFHSEVSNKCAYDYECALPHFARIYHERGWCEWTCGRITGLCK